MEPMPDSSRGFNSNPLVRIVQVIADGLLERARLALGGSPKPEDIQLPDEQEGGMGE